MLTLKSKFLYVVMFSFLTCQMFTNSKTALAAPSDWHVMIGSPYFYGDFDAAGYSDWIWWGPSPDHNVTAYHEVLSGEYGAALYYNGISTDPNAMWLTDYFKYPDWPTYSNFAVSGIPSSWDDSNNPVPPNQNAQNDAYQPTTAYDTGRSILISGDGKIQVTIDYEVVDLGAGNWSPMSIRDSTGQIGFVKSDRYLFLQTYIIKNLQNDANITGLELYQMLHSHGADDYGPTVNASYTNANYNDPLDEYNPYNPVHTVGNFRYDFTQWNNINDPNKSYWVTHTDWVGFSCTVAPDVYECGDYNSTALGSYGKPLQGVHIDIEKRNLNQSTYRYGETAGALGWHLGNLAHGQSKSITVAFMFGYGPIDYNQPVLPPGCDVNLTQTNDISGCVEPNNFINYQICYSTTCDINDVNIIDELPIDVDFNSCTGGGVYNEPNHTVTWSLGNRQANDSNCFTLKVKVAQDANGGSTLTNTVKMYSGGTIIKTATKNTQVCCMNPVVYVDANRPADGNGKSWQTAYKELRNALTNVRDGNCGCANQIWGHSMNISLVITEGYIDILINLFLYSECCIIKK